MARKGYKTASFTLPDGTRKYVYAKTQEELDEKVFNLKLQMKMGWFQGFEKAGGTDSSDNLTAGHLISGLYHTGIRQV